MFGFLKRKQKPPTTDGRLRHIAFIMDGNGRWAKARGLARTAGHGVGARVFQKSIHWCKALGITHATYYAFSSENWNRPKEEVDAIMRLLDEYIEKAAQSANEEGVRVHIIGDLSLLSDSLQQKINDLHEQTKAYDTFHLNIAISYGARGEIVRAVNTLIENGASVTEASLSSALYTAHSGDPDLIVRTGGELRLSNFLLWQSAYSELYFTKTLWPNFTEKELTKIVEDFKSRHRRFGGL
ncbi:MAG: di-trans,poly-cis-decaprenylcistransferase [Clostridia bacterium]|nr:di-trans,poly-cis-decaprenylcistransferase [Clostridia bacterium]